MPGLGQQPPAQANWPSNQPMPREEVLLNYQQQSQVSQAAAAAFIMSQTPLALMQPSSAAAAAAKERPNLPPSHPNSGPAFRCISLT